MAETEFLPDSKGFNRPMNRSRKTLNSPKSKKTQENHTKIGSRGLAVQTGRCRQRTSRFCSADSARFLWVAQRPRGMTDQTVREGQRLALFTLVRREIRETTRSVRVQRTRGATFPIEKRQKLKWKAKFRQSNVTRSLRTPRSETLLKTSKPKS